MTKPTDEQIKQAVNILKKIEDYSFTPANSSNYFTHIASIPPLAKDAIKLLSGNPEPPKLDLNKPMQFREPKVAGEFLGVLATDLGGNYPVLVKLKTPIGRIATNLLTLDGEDSRDRVGPADLINIPEPTEPTEPPKQKREGWVILRSSGVAPFFELAFQTVYCSENLALKTAEAFSGEFIYRIVLPE